MTNSLNFLLALQGMAIIRQLRQLEERTGRRIHELFDLICGTSTGGILAVALALKHFTLDECEQVYRCATSSRPFAVLAFLRLQPC